MMKWIASCSGLVVGAVAIGACYGTVDGSDPEVALQDRAALVSKKRQWLERFDRHCDACFAAFDLCKIGAEPGELDACRTAMDACVRGGLLGDDAGLPDAVVDEDAGEIDADPGVDEDPLAQDAGGAEEPQEDDEEDAGDVDDDLDERPEEDAADAGLEAPEDEPDAGDVDEGLDGGVVDDDDDDADDEGLDDRERAKEVLIGEIGVCLDLARSCLEPEDADAGQCVRGLSACVQQALEEAFEVICTEQVRACRAEKQPRSSIERVERECRASLLI